MSKDNKPVAITPDLSLPQTESPGFAPEEMVRCESCLRANPPTRIECLYCATPLPLSVEAAAQARPLLRPLEKWEQGQNCILLTSPEAGLTEEAVAEATGLLRLGVLDLGKILQAGRPLPLVRTASGEEAALIQQRMTRLGLETVIVSDEALGLESPVRRLRTMNFSDTELVFFPSNGPAETTAWSEVGLVVTGRMFSKQLETKERMRRGAEKLFLDARETTNDEAVLDLYTQKPDGGWRVLANNFDFSCLGERKSLLAAENFATLVPLILERALQAEHDDSYHSLRHSLELAWPSDQETSSRGWRRDMAGKYSTSEVAVTSNEAQFTRYSRLLHFLKFPIGSEVGNGAGK